MDSTVATTTLLPHSSLIKLKPSDANPRICFVAENTNNPFSVIKNDKQSISHLSTFPCHVCIKRNAEFHPSPKVVSPSSVVSSGYAEEPERYREKVFAITGAKVYAAGCYTNQSIFSKMRGEDVHLQRYKRIHHFFMQFFRVCIASEGIPSSVDATIESSNVTYALFNTFLEGNPVSALLKASTSTGLAVALD